MPTPSELQEKAFMLGTVFKPAAPINRADLFAGRQSQIRDILDAITQQGQHAVLYGERGVGKTSLANMILPNLRSEQSGLLVVQVNCMSDDTYHDLWKRVFEEIQFKAANEEFAMAIDNENIEKIFEDHLGSDYAKDITPDVVRRFLYLLGQDRTVIIALDEYDTIASQTTRALMSNTLKFLSDRAVPATIVLIGVSDDVETLVADHRSVERCIKQILMPRMSEKEIKTIVLQGLRKLTMTIDPQSLSRISRLSRGLPHYAHLLGLHAGRAALDAGSLAVTADHVQPAIHAAIEKAQASIQSDYSKAITSSRREALYREVLVGCALAKTDDWGWFYPRDVREPLKQILKRDYKIEAFARHLHAFCEEERGPVLIKDTNSARPRFRFENPLMQPFVLIKAIDDGLIGIESLSGPDEDHQDRPMQGNLF